MNVTIHVYLLDEGIDMWRPVLAERVRDDIYRITGAPPDDTEKWEFMRGDVVRCRQQNFNNGEMGLVAYEKIAA
jgi:hypothetical protein